MGKRHEHTLCWDCKNATSMDCPWVDRGVPVEGWRARKTTIRFACENSESYHVHFCPLFERDAANGGLKKVALGGENGKGNSGCGQSCTADARYRMAQHINPGSLGNSRGSVVDRGDRQTRLLREDLDLAFGIIEQAVRDWKSLENGRKEETMVEKGEWVSRTELVEFFFSKWFSRLCEPLHYSPEEIREALRIPEDALWTIRQS